MVTTAEAPPASEAPIDPEDVSSLAPADFVLIRPESVRLAKENRAFVDDENFRLLVDDVRQFGVLVPILVRTLGAESDDGNAFELVAGERRLTAAKEIGLKTVPAFILDYEEDADRLAVMWSENFHRRDLTTMEKARHVGHLLDLDLSQRDVAERLGISQPQVSKLSTLLKLPEHAHAWVDKGEMSQEEAVRLASLPAAEVKKLVPPKAKEPPAPWRVSQAYDDVIRQGAMVKGRELAKEKGLKVHRTDRHVGTHSYQNSAVRFPAPSDTGATLAHVDKKAHEKEKCHAVIIETRGEKPLLVPVCTNPDSHPRPKGWKPAGAEKAGKAAKARTEWEERRKRKSAAIALHLPFFQDLAEEALAVALKRDEDDYCLDFAAWAFLETSQPLERTAQLLGLGDARSPDKVTKSLLSPTPDTVDGFAVLYAGALAGGLDALEDEIGTTAEWVGQEKPRYATGYEAEATAFLNHLDGLIDGVPKYEELIAAVKSGKPLGAQDDEDTATEDEALADAEMQTVTVTFSTQRGRVVRTCSVHGKLGSSQDRENAHVLADKHIADEHAGVGVVQDELSGV